MCNLGYSFSADVAILTVPPPLVVTEEDEGSVERMACFYVAVNRPRDREVVYQLVFSNMSTATYGVDFEVYPLNVTVPTNFDEDVFMSCVRVTILGDDVVEEDEIIRYRTEPLYMQDRVNGSDVLIVTILDEDGKKELASSILESNGV